MLYNKRPLIYIPKKKKIVGSTPAPVDPTVYKNMMFGRIPTYKLENGAYTHVGSSSNVFTVCFKPTAHGNYPQTTTKILGQDSYVYLAGTDYQFTVVFLNRYDVSSYNLSDIATKIRWSSDALSTALNVHAYFVRSSDQNIYHIKNLRPTSQDPSPYSLGLSLKFTRFTTANNITYGTGIAGFGEWSLDYDTLYWSSVAQPFNQIQNKLSSEGILPTSGGALMLIFGGSLDSGYPVIPNWDDNTALSLINDNPGSGRFYWGAKYQVVDFDMQA